MKTNTALSRAFRSVGAQMEPGEYLATIRRVELVNSDRGFSVRAKFEIDDQTVSQFFGLTNQEGKALGGGIIGVKHMLHALGYDEEQFQGNAAEENLKEAFAEITGQAPEVKIRLSYSGGFQNIRVLEVTGREPE